MASPEAVEDYYAILEIPVYATASSIRDAYRKLALKYHPDKNKTESATSDFQRLGRAWDVLQDPAKRAAYD
ncbi:DnaJ domain-containing protein, partial [Halenospora varia]